MITIEKTSDFEECVIDFCDADEGYIMYNNTRLDGVSLYFCTKHIEELENAISSWRLLK